MEYWSDGFVLSLRVTGYELRALHLECSLQYFNQQPGTRNSKRFNN
jgi:hypothetical protein